MSRPEYVKCIAATHVDRIGRSLCERRIGSNVDGELRATEFVFVDIDHWFYNNAKKGRLLGCPQCLAAIKLAVETEGEV